MKFIGRMKIAFSSEENSDHRPFRELYMVKINYITSNDSSKETASSEYICSIYTYNTGLIYNLGKLQFQLKHALNYGLKLVCVNINCCPQRIFRICLGYFVVLCGTLLSGISKIH